MDAMLFMPIMALRANASVQQTCHHAVEKLAAKEAAADSEEVVGAGGWGQRIDRRWAAGRRIRCSAWEIP
ncbi:hypothetical protein ACWKWK_11240 [Pseudoxanthomonas beigongshangi]